MELKEIFVLMIVFGGLLFLCFGICQANSIECKNNNKIANIMSAKITMTKSFIMSTAKDYDMEVFEVEKIANKNEDNYKNFYIELELFIKQRENE